MAKHNAAQRIRQAMQENERQVLTAISGSNSKKQLYRFSGASSIAWMNALTRLEQSGKIRYVRGKRLVGGWAIVGRSTRSLV